MTEERGMMPGLPAEVIREDQRLEEQAHKVAETLAWLRWHWTLDESNLQRVSFAAYGRAVGKGKTTIAQYAHGYVLLTQSNRAARSFTEVLEQVNMSASKRSVVEAVAEQYGIAPKTARQEHRSEIIEVKYAVENEAERREEAGRHFDAEERAEHARKVAAQKKATRDAEERYLQEQRKKHNAMFLEVDARLSKARRELKEALDTIRDVEFSEEEVVLLERQNEAVEGMSRLVASALVGDSGTDWDAELKQLEERRQYG